MAVGILNPDEPRDDFKLVYRADTKLNPPTQRKAEPKRRKRAAITIPTDHPISMGDMVIARDYLSGGSYRKQFTGTGIVKAISREIRKDFNTGKRHLYNRMTVIVEGRRFDVLEGCLQYVGTPAPQPAPVVTPSPLPEKVEVIELYPLLLAPPQIAGYLPARIEDNWDTVAAVNRTVRHGGTAVVVNVGKRKFWVRNPDGTIEKREVAS